MSGSVFVVVPALNEGNILHKSIEPLVDMGYSVVVVDDGSSDDTWAVLRTLPVYSLRHAINLGQGAALQTGMTFALNRHADYIVHFDADGQHRAADIPSLLEPLEGGDADVVLGSRFLRRADSDEVPPLRRLVLRAGVWVNAAMTGVRLTDAHNGFRAFTRKAAMRINLEENRFAHASEILSQIHQQKLRYVERPTSIVYTEYSRAKGQSSWDAIKIVIDLLLRRIFR
jgi:glycosyltransferase involved in cell wall biosynthesis